ncbi:MAG: hypothetical protein JRF22_07925, partial [Deltaproteobacteria bacterium]|nr:hypothetical protein [Deltaproteobacteria bacterium]
IMFPYIFFISLVALCMGVLNSLKHFAAPALAPVLLNLAMILSAIFLMPYFSQPILALAFGVILGGFLQLALQIPYLKKNGAGFKLNFNFSHPGLKKMAKLMLPAVLGAAVYQVNMVIITMIASLLPAGSISYLYYSDRIFQFPLALFGLALATASLPAMSNQVARSQSNGRVEGYSVSCTEINSIYYYTCDGWFSCFTGSHCSHPLPEGGICGRCYSSDRSSTFLVCSGVVGSCGGEGGGKCILRFAGHLDAR